MIVMSKIAIDIVLLPPEEIMDLLIEINKKEAEKGNAKQLMGKDDFIPHLSLNMGCVNQEDLPKIYDLVKQIATKFSPIPIELYEIFYGTDSKGERSYAFVARKGGKLQQLHEELMDGLKSFISYEATVEMYFTKEGEKLDAVPKGIPMFKERNRENFSPHITMLCKELEYKDLPIKFIASRLVVCHSGIHTSCRKILFEQTLNN